MTDKQNPFVENALIEGMSSEGKGFAKINGKIVFVEFAVPGDVADIEIRRDKKKFAEGILRSVKQRSSLRVEPECSHFGVCGGCKWQHVLYTEQLKFKRQIVEDAFSRIGKVAFPAIPEVIGCGDNYYYRNKLEFTFTDRRWLTDEEIRNGQTFEHRNGLGFHVTGNFRGVLDIEHCYLQADPSNQIRLAIRDFALQNKYPFFDLVKQQGFLRNLLIRTTSTGEILVLISFYENDDDKIKHLLRFVDSKFPEITSLQYVINSKRNDTIYDLETIAFKGRDHLIEQLGKYRFKIGPKSFFQTNSKQVKVLYDMAKEFAGLKGDESVYDLYTGVGSIALYISDQCRHVTGIEQVASAIEDAKENMELNGVTNCSFHAGDVKDIVNKEFISANGRPSVVFTDPPRAGMHTEVVYSLLKLEAQKVVYVSCNPSTQARDLQLLNEKYEVKRVQPVDMFPHTTHIENVALLELR